MKRDLLLITAVVLAMALLLLGRTSRVERIVAGTNEDYQKHPWLVSLPWGCGGALIGKRTVLTAAHCIDTRFIGALVVIQASTNIRELPDVRKHLPDPNKSSLESMDAGAIKTIPRSVLKRYGEVRRITDVIRHPSYGASNGGMNYDYAIVYLDTPSSKTPIDLTGIMPGVGTPVRATGYGLTKREWSPFNPRATHDKKAKTLQTVVLYLISRNQCGTWYKKGIHDRPALPPTSPSAMCAHHPIASTCAMDSGTPLVWQPLPLVNKVVGIVSGSADPSCGSQTLGNKKSIFANVPFMHQWIRERIRN